MGPGFGNMGFGMEVIYSYIVILISLIIYFSTKEIYELSSHKGIKYFRLAFLFFAIAYFFRSFIKFVSTYFGIVDVRSFEPSFFFGFFTLTLFTYFSTMAILYLIQSILYKRFNGGLTFAFHLFAVLISISTIFYLTSLVILIINFILLFLAFGAYYLSKKQSKKNKFNFIYGLVTIFWLVNFIDVLIPHMFRNFQIWIYLVSITLFIIMLYKVLRNLGAK